MTFANNSHFINGYYRLLTLVESGIVKYMLNENLTSAKICPQNLGGTERQLRNSDLSMTYWIMLAGFCTSVVIFFTEVSPSNAIILLTYLKFMLPNFLVYIDHIQVFEFTIDAWPETYGACTKQKCPEKARGDAKC